MLLKDAAACENKTKYSCLGVPEGNSDVLEMSQQQSPSKTHTDTGVPLSLTHKQTRL